MADMIDANFETALRAAWSEASSGGDATWQPSNPAAGHCDVTSLVIRERLGGDLRMAQVFRDGELSEHHYWNVLPGGAEFDLTGEQFDGSETFGPVTDMTTEFFASAGPIKPELLRRLDVFRAAVEAAS